MNPSAITIAARGTLTNDAWNMLDRNSRTHFDKVDTDGDTAFWSFGDGDIHVQDRETTRWHGISHAELRAYIERVDPFQRS